MMASVRAGLGVVAVTAVVVSTLTVATIAALIVLEVAVMSMSTPGVFDAVCWAVAIAALVQRAAVLAVMMRARPPRAGRHDGSSEQPAGGDQ